jgi:murein DD-endopeptidase MepM/ murein hydrolase activator NlpD
MKHKSILFVSPGGTSVKAIKIRVVSVVIVVIVVLCGFSAYFIPSEKFRIKAAEVKQKQRLSVQNEMLHQRIVSALGMLNRLKQQIVHLDAKKKRVAELTGEKDASPKKTGPSAEKKNRLIGAGTDPAVLLEHSILLESRFMSFVSQFPGDGKNPFDDIPVCKPTPDDAIVALHFGKAKDPFTGRLSEHRGVDLAVAAGTPVIATAAGTVVRVEDDAMWGKRIVITHADGITTVYAHLGTVSTASGRTVKRGAVIGTVGSSGLATGPHVHYEIWKNGTAVDPELFFYPGGTTRN